jgi:hypothetical protein
VEELTKRIPGRRRCLNAEKKILTIGLELADGAVEEEFISKASLLDWDIILFKPTIEEFINTYTAQFHGKPSLNDRSSFALREACEHWRREIKEAVEHGKTVVVFLPPLREVYIDTGRREYSGTGRNQKTTTIVDLWTNYSSIPLELDPVSSSGSAMKLGSKADILAPIWNEFVSRFEYKVLLSPETPGVCLTTKTGDRPVGAIVRAGTLSGALVCLPDIDFVAEEFFELDEEGDQVWTDEGTQFSHRLIAAVVALETALRSSVDVTPEPSRATEPAYALAKEQVLRSELLEAERQVEAAQRRKEDILELLKGAGNLRALLYEKGHSLERAIIESLKLLGFKAANYKNAESEFDVVFESEEGRLLGEAEGKDAKAVNVDKLRQLMMNIQEDLQRDEIESPAKGVLFGNGYRLSEPKSREVQFTQKCITAAATSNTALVATSDLFWSAQHLANTQDAAYSKLCRETILQSVGLVALPAPPASTSQIETSDNDNAKRAWPE